MNSTNLRGRAIRAMLWSQLAYWSALAIAAWAYVAAPRGSIRTALILTPIVPGILIFAVARWLYTACDEYIRLRVLRATAATALIVGILVLTYFFLELSGLPRLSMMWVSLAGWSIFIAQMLPLMREPR